MRKYAFIVAAAALVLSLSGCATMFKAMGVATLQDIEVQRAELSARLDAADRAIAELGSLSAQLVLVQDKIREMDASLGQAMKSAEGMAALRADMDALMAMVDALPDETLRELVRLLSEALDGSPAPVPAAPSP